MNRGSSGPRWQISLAYTGFHMPVGTWPLSPQALLCTLQPQQGVLELQLLSEMVTWTPYLMSAITYDQNSSIHYGHKSRTASKGLVKK